MNPLKQLKHFRSYLTLQNGTVIVALLIALGWLWGTVGTLQKNFMLQQQVDDLDQQIEIAKVENATLKLQQQYYRSNEYLELVARQKLNKAAPGEKLIILPPVPKAQVASNETRPEPVEPSNLQQWLLFFFGRERS